MKQKTEHRKKLTLARRMRTLDEIKKHVSAFNSKAWEERKANRATRAHNREVASQYK